MKSVVKANREHSRQKRSQRLLMLVAFFVIAGQLGMGILLDYYSPKVRFTAADDIAKAVTQLSRSPDLLLLGSSRFAAAINIHELRRLMRSTDGEQAPQITNAAFEGADPYSMHYLLRLLTDHGRVPGAVIIEVSPETVKLAGPFQAYQVTRVLTWKDMPEAMSDLIEGKQHSRLLSSRLIPVFLYRRELLTHLVGVQPPYLSLAGGTKPHSVYFDMIAEASPVATSKHHVFTLEEKDAAASRIQESLPTVRKWLKNYHISGLNPRHLQSMLAYLQAHNVAVALVGVPVAKMHFECYSAEINRKFLDYMDMLCRTYGCRFVDYRNRFSDDLFRDSHHLNVNGAIEFSRMLHQEVL